MIRFWKVLLLVSFTVVLMAGGLLAEENTDAKIRVLFVSGGHPFDEAGFKAMLDSFPQIQYQHVRFPDAWSLMKPDLAKDYDVLLLYDMYQPELSDEQKANFVQLFKTGIGVFALHHTVCGHIHWDTYYDMVGGRIFYEGGRVFRGVEYPASTCVEGQDIPIEVVDKTHPITRGVENFTIHDEAYGNILVHPEVKVLLKANHPLQTPQTGWLWHYGKSPVFTLMLGHDRLAYENPNFRKIVIQGIEFLAKERKNQAEER